MKFDIRKENLLVVSKCRGKEDSRDDVEVKNTDVIGLDEEGYLEDASFVVEDTEGNREYLIRLYCAEGCNFDFHIGDIIDIEGYVKANQEVCERIMSVEVTNVDVKKRLSEMDTYHKYIDRECLIEQEDLFSYKQNILQYLNSIDNTKDYSIFLMVIEELVNNVYDHAQIHDWKLTLPSVFISYDNYFANAEITFRVSDNGYGLVKRIKNYYNHLADVNYREIINLALKEGFSTNCKPHNKGLGLFNTMQFIESCVGNMVISVSDGIYIIAKTDHFINDFYFEHLKTNQGTKVELQIYLNNLPLLEHEVDICS